MKGLQPVLAKLSRPRLYAPVARERLFKLLDELRAHPLIWVNGPPGAGKTTLVASWLDAAKIPALWYQLDSADSDAAAFFFYLVHLSRQFRAQAITLPFLTPEYLNDLPGFTRRFFREFFACMSRNAVLVLDNAQDAASETLHGILREAATQMPAGLNLVVLSRSQPPEELSRLLANGELVTIDWQQLRLSLDETRAIIAQSAAQDAPSFAEIHQRIDGWVAGLVLLLANLKRGQPERPVNSLNSRESLFAYFAGEIFNRASIDDQELLMKTALLPQVSPAAAVALTGRTEAAAFLERLFRLQYFVDRRTDPELSYRYHDLFREFLLARAEQTAGSVELSLWRITAAGLLAGAQEVGSALALLGKAGAWDEAATLIIQHAPTVLAQGRWATLQSWITEIPDTVLESRPWLIYWLGTSKIPIDQPGARQHLTRAYERFTKAGDYRGTLLSVCGIAESISLQLDDLSQLDPWIPILKKLLEEDSLQQLGDEDRFFAHSSLLGALFYRQPGHPKFATIRNRTRDLMLAGGNVKLTGTLPVSHSYTGVADWGGARELLDTLLPEIESGRGSPLVIAQWSSYAAYHFYVTADDDTAWKWFRHAEQVALSNNMPYVACMTEIYWVFSAIAIGDLKMAGTLLARATETFNSNRAFDRAQYHMARARLATALGKRQEALSEARISAESAESTGGPILQVFWNSVVAGIMADFGCYDESAAYLDRARQARSGTPIRGYDAFRLMLDAYLSLVWRNDGQSSQLLRESLGIAREQRVHYYYRSFIREIASIMLDKALREGIETEFVLRVIDELRIRPAPTASEHWPWPIRIRTLGRFEIEIDGEPLGFGRKTPKRPLALLQCVIALGGKDVPEHRLADELWPDADGDEAHRRLTLTLHRLRQLLGEHDSIRLQGGKISLDARRVWVDAFAFEALLSGILAPASSALALYRGDFLATEPEEPWMLPARDRLRRLAAGPSGKLSAEPGIRNQKETPRTLL